MSKNTPPTGNTTGAIPISTRHDGWQPTPRDLSTTPGGSIYATTPGGTRILYDRNALLNLRNSPMAKTPTKMPVIPVVGQEQKHTQNEPTKKSAPSKNQSSKSTNKNHEDDELFQMEH